MRDFDVEIAEGAARHLEVLDRYPVGTIAELAAYRGSDDSVLVEFIVRHTWEREGLTELPLDLHHMIRTDNAVNEVAGGGTLERPHLGFATLAGSARLTEGKSTHAFAACRPGGDGVLVNVTLEKAAAPPREFECGDRTLRLVDLAGNLAHGFRTPRQEEWRLDRTLASLDSPIEFVLPPLRLNGFEPAMTDSINSAMSAYADVSSGDTERGPVDVTLVAHWLACSGAKAAADAAMSSTLARMWSNADRATVALDVVDRAGGHLVRLPAAVGDGFTLAGSQSTYIVAYEVDVANNASTTDPIVRALVDGTAVWTRGGAITGSAHHRIQVRSSLLDGDPHRLVGRVRGNGPLDEPRFVTSWIDAALDVATKRDGSAAELGTLSLPENVQGTLTLVPSSSE